MQFNFYQIKFQKLSSSSSRNQQATNSKGHGLVYGHARDDAIAPSSLHFRSAASNHNDVLLQLKQSARIPRRSYGRDSKLEEGVRFRDNRGWNGRNRFGAQIDGGGGLGRAAGRKGRRSFARDRRTRSYFQLDWHVPGLSLHGNVYLFVY